MRDWKNAATRASNIGEIFLIIGDVTQSLKYAYQGVEFANLSNDNGEKISSNAKLASTLHQSGDIYKADALFHSAEEIQKQMFPQIQFLALHLAGYYYCNLLLDQEKYVEVQNRSTQTLKIGQIIGDLLSIALDNLSLGHAHLLQSQHETDHSFAESLTYLNLAVDGLKQAGDQTDIPRGFLARAQYYRVTSDFTKAQKDLDEAFAIAIRGGMGLYLADCHLEYARLHLAKGEKVKAREHWQIAKDSIEKMGYHRRDKEAQELEEQLK